MCKGQYFLKEFRIVENLRLSGLVKRFRDRKKLEYLGNYNSWGIAGSQSTKWKKEVGAEVKEYRK